MLDDSILVNTFEKVIKFEIKNSFFRGWHFCQPIGTLRVKETKGTLSKRQRYKKNYVWSCAAFSGNQKPYLYHQSVEQNTTMLPWPSMHYTTGAIEEFCFVRSKLGRYRERMVWHMQPSCLQYKVCQFMPKSSRKMHF